jgi:hypothetical protein
MTYVKDKKLLFATLSTDFPASSSFIDQLGYSNRSNTGTTGKRSLNRPAYSRFNGRSCRPVEERIGAGNIQTEGLMV